MIKKSAPHPRPPCLSGMRALLKERGGCTNGSSLLLQEKGLWDECFDYLLTSYFSRHCNYQISDLISKILPAGQAGVDLVFDCSKSPLNLVYNAR